ncbi:MAG: element excision factor XisH family protein [Spirulinaceae cyanobacterium]
MPAKDAHHDVIKNALIKAGWTILSDPYTIKYKDVTVFADLLVGGLVAAQRDNEQIVVEVKSFLCRAPMREFETALGQFMIYRIFLHKKELGHIKVVLGISQEVYKKFFKSKAIQVVVDEVDLPLVVVDIETETIVEWIT